MFRTIVSLLLVILGAAVGAQPYVVESFACEIDLRSDASMEVTERLRVRFIEPRHGIYRFIPIDLETGRGFARRLYLTDIAVTDGSGQGLGTKVSRQGSNVNIRIGDEDVVLNPGTQIDYVIRYKARNMINWFGRDARWDPAAQLYWNVTGNEWDAQIQKTSVQVRFPEGEGGSGIRARLLTGVYGSTEGMVLEKVGRIVKGGSSIALVDGVLTIEHNQPLLPGEGLTFVLDVPSDRIQKPDWVQSAWMILQPNLGLLLPLVAIAIGLYAYLRFGRDPKPGPMVVHFDPPDDITGPELGAFLDERVDQRDIASGLISLAVKGYLTMEADEVGILIKKRTAIIKLTGKVAEPSLTDFERKLLVRLNACDKPITETSLRTHVAPHLGSLKQSLYDSLVSRGYYASNPSSAKGAFFFIGLLLLVPFFLATIYLSPIHDPTASIIGAVISAVVLIAFTPSMGKRTVIGARAHDKAKGFEEFIRRARGNEFDWMAQKHPDASLFENYLPHAVALGLAREWAEAFEGIVQEMPRWYVAPHGTYFHPGSFGSDMTSISESLGSAAATPPRSSGGSGGSSGFGGGGFSGGGFGGGGGGSW